MFSKTIIITFSSTLPNTKEFVLVSCWKKFLVLDLKAFNFVNIPCGFLCKT